MQFKEKPEPASETHCGTMSADWRL